MALSDNLVAYYKLDGNSNDSVASNNGTDTNISYSSSYGKISQGASFNGSSSKIAYPSGIYNLPSGNNSYTFAGWFQVADNGMHCLLQVENGAANGRQAALLCYVSGGTLSVTRQDGSYKTTTINASGTISNNTWYFVCIRYNGTTLSVSVNNNTPVTTNPGFNAATANQGRLS